MDTLLITRVPKEETGGELNGMNLTCRRRKQLIRIDSKGERRGLLSICTDSKDGYRVRITRSKI